MSLDLFYFLLDQFFDASVPENVIFKKTNTELITEFICRALKAGVIVI